MKTQWKIGAILLFGFGLSACNELPKDGSKVTNAIIFQGINFGVDGSEWANDHECDDPRFSGLGMTETKLLSEDTRMDASDCLLAFKAGNIFLK